MKKLLAKFGKWVIVYAIADAACSVAVMVWFYFSPWWPL